MSLVKSKQRVADHGEVFTPAWMVEAMLDLVKGETERIDSRFLEPACGDGNFLVPVLRRKLAAVELKYGKSDFDRQHFALLALMCIYGIELLTDNIADCRANLLGVFAEYLHLNPSDDLYRAAFFVLSQNLIHGDAMKMCRADGSAILFAEWGYLGKGKFQQRDFRLDTYDALVRRNEAVPVLDKIRAKKEPTLDQRVSSRKPFGLATNFKGKPSKSGLKKPIQLYENQRTGWIERSQITVNPEWIDEWKVLMTAVQGTSAAVETKFLSKPIIAEPGTACTETYLVAGHFEDEETAINYAEYLRTRFIRFLVSLRKATQHATRDVHSFIPDLSLKQKWTDAKLYKRYGLTKNEIAFIESQVAEHVDDSSEAIPDDDE
jgi:hypothetical protein